MDEETLKRISSSVRQELATRPYTLPYALPSDRTFKEDCAYEYGKRCLYSVLNRRVDGTTVVDKFVMALIGNTNLLQRTSQFHHIVDWSSFDWVKLLREWFVQSCFVIELLRQRPMKELREADDPIFTPQNLLTVQRHLISSYNRFPPFFVLVEFFKVTKIQDDPRDNLIHLALPFFQNLAGDPLQPSPNNPIQIDESKPLVDLVHKALSVPVAAETPITMETDTEFHLINYATELQEAGVKFKGMKGNKLEIKFEKGVLKIPPIKVAENTTLFLLHTLIEYERDMFPDSAPRNVNDYVKFIQYLVNSPKDVELLRRSRIIENWLGNDQLIFNKLIELGNKSKISRNFTYSEIFKKVNKHCGYRPNEWMAKLWRNYCNSPWSFISFIAAVVLLLLTITQTVFSILSYHPS